MSLDTQNSPVTQGPTLVCLAGYDKGQRFLEEAARLGCRVFLVTTEALRGKAQWPTHLLADVIYVANEEEGWDAERLLHAVAQIARYYKIDRIVGLDDFDQESAALLREHFRLPGLSESHTRFFRDKFAMRVKAAQSSIPVPAFTGIGHYQDITDFVDSIPAPWMLKPRFLAGTIGLRKCESRERAWESVHTLGNQQSFYLLEQFVAGDIFHVDSIWWGGRMVTAVASAYGTPPFEVAHGGGVFTTALVERRTDLETSLFDLNARVLKAYGLEDGVSHSEFIRSRHRSELLFLETSCRVGGAFISDLIETGCGPNLWAEWARVEFSRASGLEYQTPQLRDNYAGLLVSLAREEWPDLSLFNAPEVALRMPKRHHVALILQSPDRRKLLQRLDEYADWVRKDFQAYAPAPNRPTF